MFLSSWRILGPEPLGVLDLRLGVVGQDQEQFRHLPGELIGRSSVSNLKSKKNLGKLKTKRFNDQDLAERLNGLSKNSINKDQN